jgi:hypothetical protein
MSVIISYELDMCYEPELELATYKTSCSDNDTFSKCADYGMSAFIQLQVTKIKSIY